ncbi:MAG: hypothetical protein AAFP81_10650 [Pseudomonadota bacterium]
MKQSEPTASDTSKRPILLSFGAVAISIWGLASFLPIFGLMIQDQSLSYYLTQASFLATGAVSLFTIAVTLDFLKGQNIRVARKAKPRLLSLTLYASLWLLAYYGISVYA